MQYPPKRVDCHAHIVDPKAFAIQPGIGYFPRPDEAGTAASFRATLGANGVSHAVLVQPSCYGTDNAAMLDTIASSGRRMKGIAVIAPDTTESMAARLCDGGIVGVRFNLEQTDRNWFRRPEVDRLLAMISEFDWFLEVFAVGSAWTGFTDTLAASGVRLLIDHFGAPILRDGPDQPGFQSVLKLGRETPAVIKLSAPYRLTDTAPDYDDLTPYLEQIIEVFGIERCLWGSDWPYLNLKNRRAISYADLLNNLESWIPERADREKLLWANPQLLFGF